MIMRNKILFVASLFLCQVAYAIPVAQLTDLDGKPAQWSCSKNKVLVVFWGTWCAECKEKLKTALPELDRSPDVAVITINADRDTGRAKNYVESEKIAVPVFADPSKEFRRELKVFSVPHWAVYNRKSVADAWQLVQAAPAFDWDQVKQALAK